MKKIGVDDASDIVSRTGSGMKEFLSLTEQPREKESDLLPFASLNMMI
jgi:hypothetical protein